MHAKNSRAVDGSFIIAMHPTPRRATDILASAKHAPPKKTRKPAKLNPFATASDALFAQFPLTSTGSTSTHSSTPVPFPDISTESGTFGPYVPPSAFKFISASSPDTFFFSSMSLEKEKIESDSDSSRSYESYL